jgi:GPH family glycoside/pentoside/hexuronide:cation symporter
MSQPRANSFNYAIGMFGTSIPINMLKTFAFTFYVLQRGVTTTQWATMMLIYAFIDAIDIPTGRARVGVAAGPGWRSGPRS